MATARLRRTFHYPADSDDDEAAEVGMDEQDRETLLTNLATHDTTSTTLYTHILLILPLAPLLLYLPRLLSISTFIQSLVAIASLLASAYTLYYLPLPPAAYPVSTPATGSSTSSARRKPKTPFTSGYSIFSPPPPSQARSVPFLSPRTAELLRVYTIPVNSFICALLAIVELFQRRSWSEGMMIGGGYVPGFVWAFILWARRELRTMDLSELERLSRGSKRTT